MSITNETPGLNVPASQRLEAWMKEVTDLLCYQPEIPLTHKTCVVDAMAAFTAEVEASDAKRQDKQLKDRAAAKTNADSYGFLFNLRECTFHWSEEMRCLTIKAPEGFKIGLPFADGIKALTPEQVREARMANDGKGQF